MSMFLRTEFWFVVMVLLTVLLVSIIGGLIIYKFFEYVSGKIDTIEKRYAEVKKNHVKERGEAR